MSAAPIPTPPPRRRAAFPWGCVLSACLAFVLLVVSAPAAPESQPTSKPKLVAPPKRDAPGLRFKLPVGDLYVPSFFDKATSGTTDVVIFFHGASWCAEQNFHDARKNAVLLSVNGQNLEERFRSREATWALVNETTETLALHGVSDRALGRVCLASFSGGYSSIRAILRNGALEGCVSDLVLADSLYAGKVAGSETELDPEQMAPFVAFARRAAAGETTMVFSQLYPPLEIHRGNTTTLAARHLMRAVGIEPTPATGKTSAGAEIAYRADRGGLHIVGYSGMTTQDHFNHFYGIADLFRQTSLPDAPPDE